MIFKLKDKKNMEYIKKKQPLELIAQEEDLDFILQKVLMFSESRNDSQCTKTIQNHVFQSTSNAIS